MARKQTALSKDDVNELIIQWFIKPILFIIIIFVFYLGGRSIVKEIYAEGCTETYKLNEQLNGPSYIACRNLFEK